jgi:hypothetical protein
MDNRGRDDARPQDAAVEEIRPDEAVFDMAPLRQAKRSYSLVAAAAFAIGIVGVAIAGGIGRESPSPIVADVPHAPAVVDVPGVRTSSQRLFEGPFGPLDGRTGVTPGRTGRPLLTIDAQRSDGLVFVHGDVFTRRAVNVVVVLTVADGRNRTITVQSVGIPGGSTAFRLGPNERFDTTFHLPASPTMQPTTVSASAYDDAGVVIASATTQLGRQFAIEAPVSYR